MESSHDESETSSRLSYTKREWLKKLDSVDVFESDIHRLIMKYFVTSACEDAAKQFAIETNAECGVPLKSIRRRVCIKRFVIRGEIDKAVELLNDIDITILQNNFNLEFRLKKLQLYQIIENSGTICGLEFAQKELAPCVRKHPELLPLLEEAMTFLALPNNYHTTTVLPIDTERNETAREIDDALLEFYEIDRGPSLETLVKNLSLSQTQLESKNVDYGKLVDLISGRIVTVSNYREQKIVSEPKGNDDGRQNSDSTRRTPHGWSSGTGGGSSELPLGVSSVPVIRVRRSRDVI